MKQLDLMAAQLETANPHKFHIVTRFGLAACGGQEIRASTTIATNQVKTSLRCKREGCVERWPPWEGLGVDGGG